MLSFLTYNLWHGLAPEGLIRFREIEPRSRRKLRNQVHTNVLKENLADILFLQEVNPVKSRSQYLAQLFGYQPVFERDSSGLKLGPLGPPYNLDSGLCVLLNQNQHIEWKKSLQLSGDSRALIHENISVQFSEVRKALLVSVVNDQVGRMLLVNTHLHHGIEMSESIYEEIADLKKRQVISEAVEEELVSRLESADARRMSEMKKLIEEIESLKGRYNMIVVGGDFNSSPSSEVMNQLNHSGFQRLLTPETCNTSTWDPEKCQSNHLLYQEHIPTLLLEDLSFNSKVIEGLHQLATRWENRPRRIDDIYFWSQNGEVKVQNSQVFGEERDDLKLAGSDHLGYRAEVRWTSNHS